jgi:hypothetical protein
MGEPSSGSRRSWARDADVARPAAGPIVLGMAEVLGHAVVLVAAGRWKRREGVDRALQAPALPR